VFPLLLISIFVWLAIRWLRKSIEVALFPVIVSVLLGQAILWVLKPSGEVVLLPWEYPFLYTALSWALYSVTKAVITAFITRSYKSIGLWLLILALLQPTASAINTAINPCPHVSSLIVGNITIKALLANTRLRAECGYYCWTKAKAIVFVNIPSGYQYITMIGINKPLLLVVVKERKVAYMKLLHPWRIYKMSIPPESMVVETTNIAINVSKGSPAEIRPLDKCSSKLT